MYAVLFWFAQVVSAISIIGTFVLLIRKKAVTVFDLLLFILPFTLWIGLSYTWPRPKSLSNLIELFALFPVLAMLFAARALTLNMWGNMKKSIAALSIGVIAAMALYAFVPLLPE